MSLKITIVALEARRGGDEAELTVKITAGESREETQKLAVGTKMLFEIGNIGVGVLPYELTQEQFDTLEYDAELWKAVKKGIDLLAYSDNTKFTLTKKLRERSFDKYIAEDAAEYLADAGYIDEKRMLERAVEQLANVKLYGKSRIKSELFKKGISREVLSEYLDECFDKVDFEENLIRLLEKKCDLSAMDDRKYRESLYAAMYRCGYSVSDVRAAIKQMEE